MEGGEIVTGANVENASYGLSLCAETVAIATASASGRLREIVAVAVIGGAMDAEGRPTGTQPVSPCGRCRQVINEAAQLAAGATCRCCAARRRARRSPATACPNCCPPPSAGRSGHLLTPTLSRALPFAVPPLKCMVYPTARMGPAPVSVRKRRVVHVSRSCNFMAEPSGEDDPCRVHQPGEGGDQESRGRAGRKRG